MGNKLGTEYVPPPESGVGPKKHFCVIGAGSSALIIMKELTQLGHKVTCYEKLPTLGGVYVKSYQNTILTTSSLLTAWSAYSDGKEDNPKFWTAEEYLEYCENFAKQFNLHQYINYLHQVKTVRRDPDTKKWHVTVQPGLGCSNVERCKPVEADPNAKPFTEVFDGVCVCSGTNTWSCLPEFPGQENFKGEIIHSEDYRNPDKFAGKRVLIVGAGESGSDITNEISRVAAKCAIAIRGKHGHLIPRIQGNGRVTDLNTNRCRYSNPYVFGDYIGYYNQWVKRLLANFAPPSDMNKVLRKIGELNMKQGTSAFSKFGCKNEGFVAAMVLRDAELHRDEFVLEENKAVFKDQTEFVCDSIVACTGYRNTFPFFDEFHPELATAGCNPRSNFKQSIVIQYPGEIAFFGFARPAFGSIPPATEMQSRLFSYVVNGDIKLPSAEEMTKVAAADQANWEMRFKSDAKRVKGLGAHSLTHSFTHLVDFQLYTDGIASFLGVMPPLMELFFKKPLVWVHVMFGPFTMHQYRLCGPYADKKRAEMVLLRQPLGDLLESTITASFLITAKFLSLLGFSKFKPNNF